MPHMDSKDHGSSIITRLRIIIEQMHCTHPDMSDHDAMREEAERLLPLAEVDEVEVIILREASAIANARGDNALAERLETLRYFIADEQATPAWRGGISQTEAEAIAYEAINTFIVRSAAPIPLTYEGLNTIKNAAQQALEHRAPGRWMVDAALPDSDWSRTPAVTVRPAPDTRWHKDGFKPEMPG